jgi:hypothetical protein
LVTEAVRVDDVVLRHEGRVEEVLRGVHEARLGSVRELAKVEKVVDRILIIEIWRLKRIRKVIEIWNGDGLVVERRGETD